MVSIDFTVSGENEAGVDLVLKQTFLLYYVNQVLYANHEFLKIISIRKGKRFVSEHGQPQPDVYSKARILSPQL